MLPTEDAAWVSNELTGASGSRTGCSPSRPPMRTVSLRGRATSPAARRSSCTTTAITAPSTSPSRRLDDSGAVVDQPGNTGPPVPVRTTTRVVEINDLEGLERSSPAATSRSACSSPPSRTSGSCFPTPATGTGVRELCDRTGTLLLIDETHTISAGPGGATKAWGVAPDIVTIGKTLGA